jgi:SNF2 family DNA or RNA helicase
LRGRNSLWTKGSYRLERNCDRVMMLTGTPEVRDAGDWFPLLKICDSKVYSSYWRFVEYWCKIEETPWDREIKGVWPERKQEFNEMLDKYRFRRLKKDVLPHLAEPLIATHTYALPPSVLKMHKDAKKSYVIEHPDLDEAIYAESGGALVAHLRKLVALPPTEAKPGFDAVKEWCDDRATERLAIGCWHREVAERLSAGLAAKTRRQVILIYGDVPTNKRPAIIQKWREDPTAIMVCTIAAMQEGENLQECSNVGIYEEAYIPMENTQFIGRFARQGQENTVSVTIFIAMKSIQESVHRVVKKRRAQVEGDMLEGEVARTTQREVLKDVLTHDEFEDDVNIQWPEY